ncbi:zinc-binding protein A33-like [Engystomops pustulosus]|uniref:zinc-binding protein A33-like n=1 Tax=Engystomops pustulosus TaxID=76066 RepID=UPI003AFAC357
MNPPTYEELKCRLCRELFKSPMMLGCGHSFCKTCLDEKLETQQKCPTCQERLRPGQKPTPNTLLANILSCLVRQRKELCDTHGEKLLFFCTDCEMTGCIVCKEATKHLNHTFLPMQEALEIYKGDFTCTLFSMEKSFQLLNREIGNQEEEIQKLKMSHIHMEQHLISEFKQLRSHLESLENTMRDRLRQESEANTRVMQTNLAELEKKRQRMATSRSRIQSKKDMEDARDFLADIKDFLQESAREQEEERKTEIRVEAPTLNPGLYCGPIQYMAWENMKKVLQPGVSNIVLDPATAHPALRISHDLTTICYKPTNKEENTETPKRYNTTIGVLGSRGFSNGKHFWMADVGMKQGWILGMTAESCNRKGEVELSPEKGYWTIRRWMDGNYTAMSCPPAALTVTGRPRRIGVYVDYEAGQVSFYDMSGPAHIYTFTGRFSESLYPFLSPCENEGQTIRLCHLNL